MTDLLTALMFHARLDAFRHEGKPVMDARLNPPRFFSGDWPPASVTECLQSEQTARDLHKAHDRWLAVDYKQIFEWSCAIINALPNAPASNAAVAIIAEAALEIRRAAGNQHHDLVGITFCQSVETARSDGSMYTTIPAATHRYLAERFHIKYLVVSHDPQRIFQSGNTDIGEMLVIMERKTNTPPSPSDCRNKADCQPGFRQRRRCLRQQHPQRTSNRASMGQGRLHRPGGDPERKLERGPIHQQ